MHVELIFFRGRQGAPTIFPDEFSKWLESPPEKAIKKGHGWKGVQQPQGTYTDHVYWPLKSPGMILQVAEVLEKSIRLRMQTNCYERPLYGPKNHKLKSIPEL